MYYADADTALTEDCYWYIEKYDGAWSFRNAKTNQYLSYTPAKDYVTYTRLTLSDNNSATEKWRINVWHSTFNISYWDGSVSYYMNKGSEKMVQTYAGTGQSPDQCFDIYDESGKKVIPPTATYLSSYVDSLSFDGKRLSYDYGSERFLFPLPDSVSESSTFCPVVTFKKADNANYSFIVSDSDSTYTSFKFIKPRSGKIFTLSLYREGENVASGPISFTNLPIVEINVDNANDTIYERGTISISNGKIPGGFGSISADFRHRGATALNYPKNSFNVKLVDATGADLDSTILGIRPENSWILDAMAIDRIRMRNRVCFDLWNDFDKTPYATDYENRNGTKGYFVEVILNGAYNGLYCLTDKIDRKLLNIKKVQFNIDSTEVSVRGLLYKSNSWDNTSLNTSNLLEESMDTVVWNNWELQYPDDYPSSNTWQPLKDLYNFCSTPSLYTSSFKTNFYSANTIDFYLLVLGMDLIDNGNKNMFLSVPNITKGNCYLITPWDMDTSLGGYYDGRYYGGTYDETAIADMRINFNNPFKVAWKNNVNDYCTDMAKRWYELRNGALCQDSVNAKLERYCRLFQQCGVWTREVSRWSTAGCPIVEDLSTEIKYIEEWYAKRLTAMDKYFLETTGIETVQSVPTFNAGIYDIYGRKISSGSNFPGYLPHGLYIVNGKKVVR